jgi:hypothetical protein
VGLFDDFEIRGGNAGGHERNEQDGESFADEHAHLQ